MDLPKVLAEAHGSQETLDGVDVEEDKASKELVKASRQEKNFLI